MAEGKAVHGGSGDHRLGITVVDGGALGEAARTKARPPTVEVATGLVGEVATWLVGWSRRRARPFTMYVATWLSAGRGGG